MPRASRLTRVLVTAGAAVWTALAACAAPRPSVPIEAMTFAPALDVDLAKYKRTATGVYYRDIVDGTGAQAAAGRRMTLRYVVFLPDGTTVESQETPLSLMLGPELIRGWRDALPGMRVGGFRRLIVPPSLAYGRVAKGPIPPNSTLVFEIELLGVQ